MVSEMIDTRGLAIIFVVNFKSNLSEITDRQTVTQLGQMLAGELEIRSGISTCEDGSIMVNKSLDVGWDTEIRVLFVKRPTASCQLHHIHKGILAVSGKDIEIQLTSKVRLTAVSRIAKKVDYDGSRGETIFRTDIMMSYTLQSHFVRVLSWHLQNH